jgi:hypothetical protein
MAPPPCSIALPTRALRLAWRLPAFTAAGGGKPCRACGMADSRIGRERRGDARHLDGAHLLRGDPPPRAHTTHYCIIIIILYYCIYRTTSRRPIRPPPPTRVARRPSRPGAALRCRSARPRRCTPVAILLPRPAQQPRRPADAAGHARRILRPPIPIGGGSAGGRGPLDPPAPERARRRQPSPLRR